MKKDLEKLLEEWQLSDAEEFKKDIDNFGEDEVSSDTLDRIVSSAMRKAGLEQEGAIKMTTTNKNIKTDDNSSYGEVSRFRGGMAIAACLAVAVTGVIAAKMMFGSRIGTGEENASGMQMTTQSPEQTTIPTDSVTAVTELDSTDDSADEVADNSTDDTSSNDTSSKTDAEQPVAHIDMTPEKIFSMSTKELKELSNNQYEVVKAKFSPQHQCYGYRFAAFPEYVCAYDAFNSDENSDTAIINDHLPPEWIEIDKGVDIGNGISAGMTYNEIKARCDGEIYAEPGWVWLICTTVGGRDYCFGIEDMTEEMYDALYDRLDIPKEESNVNNPGKSDASDIDPVTEYGLIFRWAWMSNEEELKWAVDHYKGVDDEWLKEFYGLDDEWLEKYDGSLEECRKWWYGEE
ncbi:hypothetical protein SAMN02910447_03495 [Ruminococcus sp. YE71]|uniref:hypothetical protein n=1 Tax=unclassified Ruminococcus TaxID=2608920 RepID=UPI000886EA55|nr:MULTISPECIES: hypothetical protein [unclassified Ruminococcus]SDA32118.1 hypothetical protein SAMN02910446_03550 [Ruminococcus sp. YE78]SFW52965.1 hypothetical protein SAMN02910447_03495 [Ruminococcus sp. YE71]